ncbi:chalcone isomerase family protein, partial [Chitinimonas sp.]|uniref:chalcone isomerase family protein n=1 Tax=Chitinimonas sp. TaxID=1934313 RepID=UPI0035AE0AB4
NILVLLLACASLSSFAAEIGGVKLDDTVKVAGQDLQLNGGAVRLKYGFVKVYVGALYTAQKIANADAAISDARPRRVVLTMLRNVEAEKLHESLLEGLEANCSDGELAALQPRIKEMNAIFQAVKTVSTGDVITLDFLPGKGTQITVRGQVKDVIAGDDFGHALLKVWLGKKPATADLKAAMLGSK